MKNKKQPQTFRANVGAAIVNIEGLVLAMERKEIPEETGIEASQLELLGTVPHWLTYEFPEEVRSQKAWRGQVQKWFLFQFTGPDDAITMGDGKEFRAWEWTSMQELFPRVVSFKQPIYRELSEYFEEYLK